MSKESSRLSAQDLRTVYMLIGECCELGADPLVWRQHFLSRLNACFGAVASVDIEATFDSKVPGIGAKVDMALTLDQFTGRERDLLTRCMREMRMEANPLGVELLQVCALHQSAAVTRRERVSDATWQSCEFMTEYFGPLGWDDMLVAIIKLPTGLRCFNFSKVRGDRPFSPRDARMLQLLVSELSAISPQRLAPMSEQSLLDLPPRMREILAALADGDNEKQIAARLGITRNTVHEYVRRLFGRFGVSSRSELMVRAARQLHSLAITSNSREPPEQISWYYRAAAV